MLLALFVACNTANKRPLQETILLDKLNIDKNNYTAILPHNGKIDSYMILIPGFGESVENVLDASALPYKVAESGIAVFIPTLQNGVETYSFSSESQKYLQLIIDDIRTRYKLSNTEYCIGGFSMGGSAAVRYAELTTGKRPVAVFAIDSPLDYQRFHYATERDVMIYRKGLTDGDSIYVKLLEEITPIVNDSPYLLSDTTHQAILPLKNIPIRYYIEPAEQWWLNNRQTDVLGLNILDATAFINDIRLIGNDRAELIISSNKGYRNNGKTYHPHSWTIVDVDDLIEWIRQCH